MQLYGLPHKVITHYKGSILLREGSRYDVQSGIQMSCNIQETIHIVSKFCWLSLCSWANRKWNLCWGHKSNSNISSLRASPIHHGLLHILAFSDLFQVPFQLFQVLFKSFQLFQTLFQSKYILMWCFECTQEIPIFSKPVWRVHSMSSLQAENDISFP